MRARPLAMALLAALAAACTTRASEIQCVDSSDCTRLTGGECKETESGKHFCTYADESCASGRRWSDLDVGDGLSGECVDVAGGDAGPPDAAVVDASILDAPVDAEAPDAGCSGCPDNPLLLAPANGTFTGSVHASSALRPRFRWRAAAGADRYELEVDDSCTLAGFLACEFPSPEFSKLDLVITNHQLTADLSVSMSAPVGRRYYWRVRACNTNGCSGWSEVWYLDVGRERTDINGDGYADVIIGAPQQDPDGNTDEGAAFIHFGRNNWTVPGTYTAADTRLTNPLAQMSSRYGEKVAAVGDVNGDGFSDLVVTASLQDDPEVNEGLAYLYYGRSSWATTVSTASVVIDNPIDQDSSNFGEALVGGDFDADGYADIAVGARYANTTASNTGQVYLFRGGSNLPSRIEAASVVLDNPGDQADGRFAYVSAGDIDADGILDLVASAIGFDNPAVDEGVVFLYFGRRTWPGILETADFTLDSPTGGTIEYFGWNATSCDVDADGYDDLVVGSPGYMSNRGRAYLYFGRDSWASPVSPDSTYENPFPTNANQFGRNMACANVGGSATSDFFIGAVDHDGPETNEGASFLYLGRSTWPATGVSYSTYFDNPLDAMSGGLSDGTAIGDVDGDGVGDALLGASGSGKAFIYLGRTSWAASITAADVQFDNPDGQPGSFGHGID